jgi:hypothetical protein
MLSNRFKTTSLITSVAIVGVLIGALFGGHLFTLITGEFPGPGPGVNVATGTKVDTSVYITTQNPSNYGDWLTQVWWRISGQMWQNPDGTWTIYWSHHAGIVTTIGKTFMQNKLGNNGFANATKYVVYISLSASAGGTNANHKQLPAEITANNLGRAIGAFASTGATTWTITKTFTDTGAPTSDIQMAGYNWDTYAASPLGNLFAEDTFTPTTLQVNDQLTITGTFTASG